MASSTDEIEGGVILENGVTLDYLALNTEQPDTAV